MSEDRFVLRILALWFLVAVAVGASGLFVSATPLAVAAVVWILTGGCLWASWKVDGVHQLVFGADLRWLVSIHLLRFVGIEFVALYLDGRFPFAFGFVGGAGDTVVATGALLSLRFLLPPVTGWRTRLLLFWNIAGLFDIVWVVIAALREGLHDPARMLPLRQFPLSLLPTFVVPLILVSHVIIAVRIWSRKTRLS